MKILLTGVTGYIGKSVIEFLSRKGHEVHGVVRKKIEYETSSIKTHILTGDNIREIVLSVKPDVVIHIASLFLASHKFENITDLIESNITFPTKLLEAMADAGVNQLINTGTSWQHYKSKSYSPVNLYAATKQAFEDIVQYYVEAKGLQCITLKIFDSYGPNDSRGKLVSLLDRLAQTKEILDMSPGEQKVDLIHIDDICRAYEIALNLLEKCSSETFKSYGLMSHERVSLKELALIYEKSNQCTLNINWGGRPYREREVMEPATNLNTLPGWSPNITLAHGLNYMNRTRKEK